MDKVSLEIDFKVLEKIKRRVMYNANHNMPKNLNYEQALTVTTIWAIEDVLKEYGVSSPFTLAKELGGKGVDQRTWE